MGGANDFERTVLSELATLRERSENQADTNQQLRGDIQQLRKELRESQHQGPDSWLLEGLRLIGALVAGLFGGTIGGGQ